METKHSDAGFFSKKNDLRNRILFTIFILCVYRLGTYIPLPGIDPEQLQIMMQGNQKGLLGMFNVFAGGAIGRMAIYNVTPLNRYSNLQRTTFISDKNSYFSRLTYHRTT